MNGLDAMTPTTTAGWLAVIWGAGVLVLLAAWVVHDIRVNLSYGSLHPSHTFARLPSAGCALYIWPLALVVAVGYGAYLGFQRVLRTLRRPRG